MKKFFKILGIILVALLFVGTFVFLYQKSQPKTTVYDCVTADTATITRTAIITGKIEPRNEVAIKPQISGIIAQLYKEAGQEVRKGEVIAKVKVIPDMGSLNAAETRLSLARLNLTQVQSDHDRAQKLYANQLISTEEMEKATLALRQQQAEVSSANEALQIVREGVSASNADFSSTLIRATIDGLILDIPVKVGNSVVMSNSFNDGTTIATIANMNDLLFKGQVDETEVAKLYKGMPMNISIGAIADVRLSARLEFIAPKVSSGSTANQFEIKAALAPQSGITIRAGYSANAEVELQKERAQVSLPEACVTFEGNQAHVYVLTSAPDAQPQQFEQRSVRTGISDGVNIRIVSGLKRGERVRANVLSTDQK